ncbi:DUF3788 domain-containing protein [Emergencia timonensis]|uniref:DUF3788 domain-containing protein n=1 Tax=Emergencia timonensis TaxID=1776384 RepID=A0A415E8I4_9FIRM|nr:DUF3788 domain-containing protein [Emergencia timonensis]MBS6178652.1 DUF3788 domain-containing protein [Clostridiales bacterium]MCB6477458.1 DUF3788 domain-containing protein [Emergencia timonensis]RHJ89998.1 DUF3788 domain-containing protein [Emergencia timonensis]BDF08927.1 hypothetical protein CE91St48_23680 [Emergencia timonensis]BDF13015.1 hypothetical protein CE91St49_23620 [Emergencia timonensis]
MLEKIPTTDEMTTLVGQDLYDVWQKLCTAIDEKYDMECLWNKGGKAWTYEYKYRRGGKTLCGLYAREHCVGFMIIFGKDERAKVEAVREKLSKEVQVVYDEAKTYHDGKWVMFEPVDTSMFVDFLQLLAIKRRPNRK